MTEDHIETRRCKFRIEGSNEDWKRFELEEDKVWDTPLGMEEHLTIAYGGRITYIQKDKADRVFEAPINTGKHSADYLYMPEAGGIRLTIGDNNYFYGLKEPLSTVVRITGNPVKVAHDHLVRISEALDTGESDIGGLIQNANGAVDAMASLSLITEADAQVWKDRYEKALVDEASK